MHRGTQAQLLCLAELQFPNSFCQQTCHRVRASITQGYREVYRPQCQVGAQRLTVHGKGQIDTITTQCRVGTSIPPPPINMGRVVPALLPSICYGCLDSEFSCRASLLSYSSCLPQAWLIGVLGMLVELIESKWLRTWFLSQPDWSALNAGHWLFVRCSVNHLSLLSLLSPFFFFFFFK